MPNPEEIGLPSDEEGSTVSSSGSPGTGGLPVSNGLQITDGLPVTNGGLDLSRREGVELELPQEEEEDDDADAMFQSVPIHNYPPPPNP